MIARHHVLAVLSCSLAACRAASTSERTSVLPSVPKVELVALDARTVNPEPTHPEPTQPAPVDASAFAPDLFAAASSFSAASLTTASLNAAPAPQFYSRSTTTLSLLLGQRAFDNDFAPVEDQLTLGLELEVRQEEGSVGFEAAYQRSSDSAKKSPSGLASTKFESSTWELSLGGRWRFEPAYGLEPYVGLGGSIIGVDYESKGAGGASDSAFGYGLYAHAGVERALSEAWRVGLDLRCLRLTDITLLGVGTEADYTQLALTIGYTF